MDTVDKLLAELEADQKKPVERSQAQSSPANAPAKPQSLDDLLSQLGEDTRRSVRSNLSQHPPISRKAAPLPSSDWTAIEPSFHTQDLPQAPEEALLAQVKSDYEERQKAEALQRQQAAEAEALRKQQQAQDQQRRLEALRAKRRAELAGLAEKWLKQLKPRSEEGRWFDEFACSYESRLEAAIDYLEALQSVGQLPD